ncbi:MAG TPA: hypothetical protein VMB79_04170 [Jatrophihabitans sp.]|nr:hypothetical protein [Jatrophihabitans sp.]
MTTVASPSQIWSSMPGWGIVADLTPSELIVTRRIKVIQKLSISALVLLVILLGGLFGYAWLQARSASSDLQMEQARSQALIAQQGKYSGATRVQASIDGIDARLSQLMTADVDLATTVGKVRGLLPAKMTLTSLNVSISKAGAASATGQNSSTGTSLDTSGHQAIGTIQLTGTSSSLTDLAQYVLALKSLPGVTNVLPTSNSASGKTVTYALNLSLTDQLLSHHYDLGAQGAR